MKVNDKVLIVDHGYNYPNAKTWFKKSRIKGVPDNNWFDQDNDKRLTYTIKDISMIGKLEKFPMYLIQNYKGKKYIIEGKGLKIK